MTSPLVMSPKFNVIPICVWTVDVQHLTYLLCCVYSSVSVCRMSRPASSGFLICLLSFLSLALFVCLPFFLSVSLCLSLLLLTTLLPHHNQVKVRELEEKCRSQSEQFNLLSKELEKFRLQTGKFNILGADPLTVCESPGSTYKTLSLLLNGLASPIGKGLSNYAETKLLFLP